MFERVVHDPRLFEDLLVHLMCMTFQVGNLLSGLDGLSWPGYRPSFTVGDVVLAGPYVDNISIVHVDDLVGFIGHGQGVTGQVNFFLPDAQNQWRTRARSNDALWLVMKQHGQGISAFEQTQCTVYRLKWITLVCGVHQVCDHFGIGLALEAVAALNQTGAQFVVVFDDAIVYHGHPRCRVDIGAWPPAEVRVSVANGRYAMCGPPGVGNTTGPF